MIVSQAQLGKKGITENFIETLNSHFKSHGIVKISVLKSAGHEKTKVKEYKDEILTHLGKKYTGKIISELRILLMIFIANNTIFISLKKKAGEINKEYNIGYLFSLVCKILTVSKKVFAVSW